MNAFPPLPELTRNFWGCLLEPRWPSQSLQVSAGYSELSTDYKILVNATMPCCHAFIKAPGGSASRDGALSPRALSQGRQR